MGSRPVQGKWVEKIELPPGESPGERSGAIPVRVGRTRHHRGGGGDAPDGFGPAAAAAPRSLRDVADFVAAGLGPMLLVGGWPGAAGPSDPQLHEGRRSTSERLGKNRDDILNAGSAGDAHGGGTSPYDGPARLAASRPLRTQASHPAVTVVTRLALVAYCLEHLKRIAYNLIKPIHNLNKLEPGNCNPDPTDDLSAMADRVAPKVPPPMDEELAFLRDRLARVSDERINDKAAFVDAVNRLLKASNHRIQLKTGELCLLRVTRPKGGREYIQFSLADSRTRGRLGKEAEIRVVPLPPSSRATRFQHMR